jgi:hypothetical protein
MIEYLLEPYNAPFFYAFAVLLVILGLELFSLVLGFGFSQFIDNIFDGGDIALETDIDSDVEFENGFISKYIAWIKVKNVPVLILLIIFLATFSITGFALQSLSNKFLEFTLPLIAAIPASILICLPLYRWVAKTLGTKLFKEETTALFESSFVGEEVEIVIGTSRPGFPAEAKFKDVYGQLHYIMVEPEDSETEFKQGTKVVLTEKKGSTFKATLPINT